LNPNPPYANMNSTL